MSDSAGKTPDATELLNRLREGQVALHNEWCDDALASLTDDPALLAAFSGRDGAEICERLTSLGLNVDDFTRVAVAALMRYGPLLERMSAGAIADPINTLGPLAALWFEAGIDYAVERGLISTPEVEAK